MDFNYATEWTTEEEYVFEHPVLEYKTLFEWMAKACRDFKIERLHLKTDLDLDMFHCYERLAIKYGIRAEHIDIVLYDRNSIDLLIRLLKLFKPTSLKYYFVGPNPEISNDLQNEQLRRFISSLKTFQGDKIHKSRKIALPPTFYKFPPYFIVENGVTVEVETVKKAIRSWYDGELDLKSVEELILPKKFRCPIVLAEEIDLPYTRTWVGFSHIKIHKTGLQFLELRLINPDSHTERPRWHIYSSSTILLEDNEVPSQSVLDMKLRLGCYAPIIVISIVMLIVAVVLQKLH